MIYTEEKTLDGFVKQVSDQHYPMTSTVIAASAAQAAALGEACLQISLDNQIDNLDWQDVAQRIEEMAGIKSALLDLCNQTLTVSNIDSNGREAVLDECKVFAELGRLSASATLILQKFRPLVFKDIAPDLEINIHLLVATAHSALHLLENYIANSTDAQLVAACKSAIAEIDTLLQQLDLSSLKGVVS
ncbi:MAG: hypothetical protein AAF485_27940 [Chloroflexota bacterium]